MSLLSAWACSPHRACAQDVVLDMSACDDPEPDVVRALVGVELRDRLVQADTAPPLDAQVVEVRCTGDEAELWLRGTQSRRNVALSSVPAALRARLLALSVAELARPQPIAAAPLASAAAEAAPAQPAGPPVSAPTCLLWAGLEAQATPLFGLGGSLLLRVRVHELLAWSSAVSLVHGNTAIDLGELRVLHASLRTGLALLLESSRASLHVGAGARAGWLRSSGEPDDPEVTAAAHFTAWYLGPALFTGVTLRVASHVFVALELELNHTLREVHANVEGGSTHTLSPWHSRAVLGAGGAW